MIGFGRTIRQYSCFGKWAADAQLFDQPDGTHLQGGEHRPAVFDHRSDDALQYQVVTRSGFGAEATGDFLLDLQVPANPAPPDYSSAAHRGRAGTEASPS